VNGNVSDAIRNGNTTVHKMAENSHALSIIADTLQQSIQFFSSKK
jgi:hypothetical protein